MRDAPAAEVEISTVLVRALLANQHPDLAHLEIGFLAEGWDNSQFRLGDHLIVRLPRRRLAVQLIEHEQRWLPRLAPVLPLPIPQPIRVGLPSELFPWPWSVVEWVPGLDAISARVSDTRTAGETLGGFFAALHQPAPTDAPVNRFRGVPLADRAKRDGNVFAALLEDQLIPEAAIDIWHRGLTAAPYEGPPLWLHGDAHAGNMLVCDGRLVSLIDWGDITSGDPASDLIGFWMVLDDRGRAAARSALHHDDDTWIRARGWAVAFAAMLLTNSADRPQYFELARRTIDEVLTSAV